MRRNRNARPPYTRLLSEVNIYTLSQACVGAAALAIDNTTKASGVWTANRLIFLPFFTLQDVLVSQFFWTNGGTVNGNTDVGIYSEDGQTKIGSSGSTANAGTSVNQAVNVTDFFLAANHRYWLALGSDSGTQTYLRSTLVVTGMEYIGIKEQLSGWSSGLPATITPATSTVAVYPMFGFVGTAVLV